MRVRRTNSSPDLKSLPLDGCDMLLCSHLDEPMSLVDLAELAPCDLPEAMARVRNLVELGVLAFLTEAEEEAEEGLSQRPSQERLSSPEHDTGYDLPPKTGVRVRPSLDPVTAKRALLGALALERKPSNGAVETRGARRKKQRAG